MAEGGLPIAQIDELDPDIAVTTPTDDGGAIVDFAPKPVGAAPIPGADQFDLNLATLLPAEYLTTLGSDVHQIVEDDDKSRDEWKKVYAHGLKLIGLRYEERTQPWANACGAFHPLLAESVVRFNAQAMMDIFPPSGPVKTGIVGKITDQKMQQARRIRTDMNLMATKRMKGYRTDTDMMLFNLPLAGSTFRKFRYDKRKRRPAADYLLTEHVVIPYAASSLESAERFALILEKSKQWFESKKRQGFYRDVKLGDAQPLPKDSKIREEKDKIEGRSDTGVIREGMYRFYEYYCEMDIPGDPLNVNKEPLPYIITVDSATRTVLSVYRNWRPDDDTFEAVTHVVQHKYMPGFGPYGLGLIGLLGGLADSATSILRQLVDAGTLANLSGGFKDKTIRIENKDDPHQPGEWRDAQVGAGTLREGFFPLPYGEPSSVLAALLGQIVDEGRRLGSVADMKITDMTGQNMPVGTTLAIIERSMKVMSGVSQRLYESMSREVVVLSEIIGDFMSDQPYTFELEESEQGANRKTDYSAAVDVIPVADPMATTMAQRIMALQAIQQLSQSAPPGMYDLKALHRDFINTLNNNENADRYIPPDQEVQPADPVTENMHLMVGKPVRAGIAQDHDAHIAVHMAALEDPLLAETMAKSPQASSVLAAGAAHVMEHLAFKYRREIEEKLGVPLPPPDEPLPEDIEYELSRLAAQAAEKLLGQNKAKMEEKRILEAMEDPMLQNERRALDIKEKDVTAKHEIAARTLDEKAKDRMTKLILEVFKEMAETERSTLAAEVNAKTQATDQQLEAAKISSDLGVGIMGELGKLATKRLDQLNKSTP